VAQDPSNELRLSERLQLRLVGDRSLFHDMFRTTYEGTESARWLLAYLTWRNALNPTDVVLVTARSILREVARAFENIEYQLPRILAATYSFTRQIDLPETVASKYAALYVAKILSDQAIAPLVVTSVSREKMIERIHESGLDLRVEGFTDKMSDLRVLQGSWCFPVDSAFAIAILATYDPMYKEIVPGLGLPPIHRPTQKRPDPPARPAKAH